MNKEFEKKLDFNSDTFSDVKKDMNFVLQRLILNMQEKESDEGSMTLKIDITIIKGYIPNYDPDVYGETRQISKLQFKHKVTSTVKINDERSGILKNEMELVMDKDTGVFKLVPIANTEQRSIFDTDFQEQEEENIIIPEFGLEPDESEEESDDITDEFFGSEDPCDDFAYEEPEEQEETI